MTQKIVHRNSLRLFFDEFAFIIPFKARFKILTSSMEAWGREWIFKSSIVCYYLDVFFFVCLFLFFWKLNVQQFTFLIYMGQVWIWFENLKISYTFMFPTFPLKTTAGLGNLCPDLSIHDTLWLNLVDIKTDTQQAVKMVLDLDRKWIIPKNQSCSSNFPY